MQIRIRKKLKIAYNYIKKIIFQNNHKRCKPHDLFDHVRKQQMSLKIRACHFNYKIKVS